MSSTAPIESKVYGSIGGGGIGATLSTFTLWLLGVTVWHQNASADAAANTVAAVPFPVAGIVILVLGFGSLFLGGYLARHTPRPLPEEDGVGETSTEDLPKVAHANHLLSPTAQAIRISESTSSHDDPEEK